MSIKDKKEPLPGFANTKEDIDILGGSIEMFEKILTEWWCKQEPSEGYTMYLTKEQYEQYEKYMQKYKNDNNI